MFVSFAEALKNNTQRETGHAPSLQNIII